MRTTFPLYNHAPAYLRDAFHALGRGETQAEAQGSDTTSPDRLCGLLWNCTDTLPRDVADDLELPAGSTYAQAARALKPRLSASR